MPMVLSDPPLWLFFIFGIAAVIATAVWFRTRQTRHAAIAAGLWAFVLALFLIDRFVESPREQSVRKVIAMAAAATAANPDQFVQYVSPQFNYQGATRSDLRVSPAWGLIREYQARINVWGFSKEDDNFKVISDTEIEIGFYAKAEGQQRGGAVLRYITVRFKKEADGEYRLTTMKFYGVPRTSQGEDPIPGFPK